MAVDVVLARGWTFEVETTTPDTFVTVNGIDNFSVSPSTERADGNHFGKAGWAGHNVAGRGMEITLDGKFLQDETTGARDAGQRRCEDLMVLIGQSAKARMRITDPGGDTLQGSFSFSGVPIMGTGGGVNDNNAWSTTATLDGAPTVALVA